MREFSRRAFFVLRIQRIEKGILVCLIISKDKGKGKGEYMDKGEGKARARPRPRAGQGQPFGNGGAVENMP